MSYNCEVAIVIGGKFKQIRQFAKHLLKLDIQDEDKLLPEFKIIKIEAGLSILAFYIKSIRWCDEANEFWKRIRTEAENADLPYLFQRIGESYDDAEEFSYCRLDNFNMLK